MSGSFDFVDLEQPVGGGIESVNFFNGRLLTAGDMTREQRARREVEARLGEALGDGIVFGLEASAVPPDGKEPIVTIMVQPGLAINGAGQLLRLDRPERIRLSRVDSTSFAAGGCQFDDCVPMSAGTYVAGEGLYLLTIAPAEQGLGRAPSNGLGAGGSACDVDRRVDSVRFRLLEVPPKLYSKLQVLKPDFRNRLAYECFGRGVLADWATYLPGGGARSPGIEGERSLIDRMAAEGLSGREVPLALIGFKGVAELTLIDAWSVRRPVSPADVPGAFHSAMAPRRPAIGRAMFAQFQQHLADLRAANTPGLKARTHFPFLPPVGVLPRMSFDQGRDFLGGMAFRGPIHINSATVELLIRESLTHPAIRSEGLEVIWLYAVAENQMAAEKALADEAVPDPYLIFASANLDYRGDARFNLHRWNYANYALGGG